MKVAAAIRTLNAAAGKFGAHVEDDSVGRSVTLQVCAPPGKLWACNSANHIVVSTSRGPQSWLDDAVRMGLTDIEDGLIDEMPEDEE